MPHKLLAAIVAVGCTVELHAWLTREHRMTGVPGSLFSAARSRVEQPSEQQRLPYPIILEASCAVMSQCSVGMWLCHVLSAIKSKAARSHDISFQHHKHISKPHARKELQLSTVPSVLCVRRVLQEAPGLCMLLL